MLRNKTSLLAGLLISLTTGLAGADATFEMSQSARGPSVYQVRDGMVRMHMSGPQGHGMTIIFDSKRETVVQIDEQRRAFTRMDRDDLQKQQQILRSRMQQMLPQMEQQMRQQMESMPQQQRQMVEQRLAAMKRSMSGAPPTRLDVRDTGRVDKAGAIPCRIFELADGDNIVGRSCVSDATQLGVDQQDFSAVMHMFRFMQQMSSGISAHLPPDLPGIPILQYGPDGQISSAISRVGTQPLAADLFRVPDGYSEMDPLQPGR